MWLDLVQSSAPLKQLALLARLVCVALQSYIDSECPGARARSVAFTTPRASSSAMRSAGFLALQALDFALERPIADSASLVSLVRALLRAPVALRGAKARSLDAGFLIDLHFAPLTVAERAGIPPPAQSTAVRGVLFVPAADSATMAAAQQSLKEEAQKPPAQRRCRRGRK